MSATPRARKPKAAAPAPPAAAATQMPHGFAFIGSEAVQDPLQAAMDAAVLEHNRAEHARIAAERAAYLAAREAAAAAAEDPDAT